MRPTAQTSVAEVAVTADRLAVPPPGAPVCWTVQLLPSQCSIRVCAPLMLPTAQTLAGDTAATAVSTLSSPPWAGLGLGTIVQPEPS